ncbi:hypothetical protein R1sor_024745 [Riccia sorocarpa]|uniref:SET domain-containing protein n=1 Tax=Riccia sorocarpa TaxID=122646 RepID=A0ABD3GVC7_9MARC
MAPERLREEGNYLFSKGEYHLAVDKYSAYIESVADRDDYSKAKKPELVFGYSNRAQGYLMLEEYSKALEDAENALRLDPTHLKSWVRKAKAFGGMKFHQQAVWAYKTVLRDFKDQLHKTNLQELLESLKAAEKMDRMTRLGRYEDGIDEYWDVASNVSEPPLMEEYVGPVEIKLTAATGRGLFATRDLLPGELLFVSNSMITVRVPFEDNEASRNLSQLALFEAIKRRVQNAKLEALEDFTRLQFLVQVAALGGSYPTESLLRDCPSMRYFTPLNGLSSKDRKITDDDRTHPALDTDFSDEMLRRIVEKRQFSHWGTNNEELNGLYSLPCLMNHSCVPNVAVTTMQNRTISKLFRAGRNIKKGDELVYAYYNINCPLDARRAFFPSLCCRCARCELEETLLAEVQPLKSLASQCNKFWEERPTLQGLTQEERHRKRNQCLICLNLLKDLLDSRLAFLTEIQKDMVRASFIRFNRLLHEPALSIAIQDCTRVDIEHEIALISVAVKAMNNVQPGSEIALAMISGIYYRVKRSTLSQEEDEFVGLKEIHRLGIEIIRILNGPHLKNQTVGKLFSYASLIRGVLGDGGSLLATGLLFHSSGD